MWALDPFNSPELIAELRRHARSPDFEVAWVGEGWRSLVEECHQRLVSEFPEYELLAVKQKEGVLEYQAFPRRRVREGVSSWTLEEAKRVSQITGDVQVRSEDVCEWCGNPGSLRESRTYVVTLCDTCDAIFADPPGQPRR